MSSGEMRAAPLESYGTATGNFGLSKADSSRVGMIAFLCSEAAFFGTLIVAYLTFMGQSDVGPTPREVLSLPLAAVNSVLLLSSSATLWFASRAIAGRRSGSMRFGLGLTIILGSLFLVGTAYEWHDLIWKNNLTISTNLFGTTYFTLIGCHAFHVTLGLLCMTLLLGLSLGGLLERGNERVFELVEWYWHFVDGVWILLFLVVYVLGR